MNSISFAIAGIMIVALLSWGVFALQFTSPNDDGSIVNAAVNREYYSASNFVGNGTVVKPGSEAQFAVMFRTTPSNITGTFNLSEGYAMGPLTWTQPSSTFSSYQQEYVLFTFYLICPTSCSYGLGPTGNIWLSGPQGNASRWIETHDAFLKEGGGLSLTLVMRTESVGNYTLHFVNHEPSNARMIVSMGASIVDFSRPFLFAGATSIAIAAIFLVITGVATRKKPKGRSVTQEPNQGTPTQA